MEHSAEKSIRQDTAKYLTFSVDDCIYAVEISKILGIVQIGQITPQPHAAPSILGIIKLRGSICTVMDLHMRLHGKRGQLGDERLALSLLHQSHRVCIMVDAIHGFVDVSTAAEQSSTFTSSCSKRLVTSCVVLNGVPIQILSMDDLFNI